VQIQPIAQDAADEAVTVLYRAHALRLTRLAYVMVGDRGLAEDIVQDAFAEVFARWSTIEPDRALHYLRRTVANGARSALRRRRTDRRRPYLPVPDVTAADDAVLRAAGHQALLDAINALPDRQRQVLVLRYYTGLSIAETAAALGIRPSAVTTSAHRAMRTLAASEEELR